MRDETHPCILPLSRRTGHGWPWTASDCSGDAAGDWPKISIVTPSFNQGEYLEKTLRSVLMQGYPNLEYVVIDGGSTDSSLEILQEYGPWLTNWVSEPDRGQSHAINKGLAIAQGELLGWLNSDDFYLPGALFRLAEAYLEDRSVGAVYGQGHIVDAQGSVVYVPSLPQVSLDNLFAWFNGGAEFMQPSCLFTRQSWLQCGPLSEELNFAMDLDLWIRIAKVFRFKRIEDVLSISLKHEQAKTTLHKELSRVETAIVYACHGNIGQARKELDRLVDRLKASHQEIEFLYSLPLAWKVIPFFRERRRKPEQTEP